MKEKFEGRRRKKVALTINREKRKSKRGIVKCKDEGKMGEMKKGK